MLGVEKTLATVGALKALAVDGISVFKAASRGALGFPALFAAVVKVATDVKDLVANAPGALPELLDLDAGESAKLGAASYDLVKAVVDALKVA